MSLKTKLEHLAANGPNENTKLIAAAVLAVADGKDLSEGDDADQAAAAAKEEAEAFEAFKKERAAKKK